MAKGAETKEKIALAALELFLKKGFHQVGFQEIAAALGLTHAAIYRHFPGKTALFLACTALAFREGRTYVDAAYNEFGDARDKLRGLVRGNLQAAAGERRALVSQVLALYYFSQFDPGARELLGSVTLGTTERIEQILRQGLREGAWKTRNPAAAAVNIHSVLVAEMFKASLALVPARGFPRVWAAVARLLVDEDAG